MPQKLGQLMVHGGGSGPAHACASRTGGAQGIRGGPGLSSERSALGAGGCVCSNAACGQENSIASSSFPWAETRWPRSSGPPSIPVSPTRPLLLLEELLVEEENEQVDVDFGLIEHLHDGYALVLQLQQVLQER